MAKLFVHAGEVSGGLKAGLLQKYEEESGKGLIQVTCIFCGKEYYVRVGEFRRNKGGCCSCGHTKHSKELGSPYNYEGNISVRWWRYFQSDIICNTKLKNKDITLEYLNELWEQQKGACALTGRPLTFGDGTKFKGNRLPPDCTASLDRIDSKIRVYEKGNVQWIHRHINRMKMDLPESQFQEWCEAVYTHNSKKEE